MPTLGCCSKIPAGERAMKTWIASPVVIQTVILLIVAAGAALRTYQ
jgi:hypothetical protein